MKDLMRRGIALVLALLICIGLMPNLTLVNVAAASVDYQYGSDNVIKNWGTRGEVATFLSPNAGAFYAENNTTYELLSANAGGTGVSDAPSSPLYSALQSLMKNAHTQETSYNDTRSLYQYTDCQKNGTINSGKISCFYSGVNLGPDWDGGSTWNREHTWPDSKGLNGNDENDIMMLRPTASRVNSSRGNKAYGESGSYYNPNSASNGSLDVRGDVARIFLYVYVRWGNVNGNGEYTTWGTNGVMESVDVLLAWMEADPVDTWEMGRNDSVESITGTRNVFVDYPELAFQLFGEEVPANMTSPSGEGSTKCDHNNFKVVVTPPTCIAKGYTTYTCQTAGCTVTYTVDYTAVIAHNYVNGVCSVCNAEEQGEMYIYYPAGGTYVSTTVNTNEDKDKPKPTLDPSITPVVWNVEKDANGYYIFSVDGQYMTSGATGNSLTMSSELTDLARWEATEADGGVYLRNVGANYNGNYNQYLEFYNSYNSFTTYGFSQSNSSIYTFQLVPTGCQHTNKETLPAQEATCGTAGQTAGERCKDCGFTSVVQQKVPATGNHNYVDNVCTVCGALLSTDEEVTISFADKANRTELTTSKQVWEQNGITVTNNKGESTTNVADYAPARFYKGSELIVAYPGMTTIVFHCNDYKDTYAADLASSIDTANGVTVTTSDKSVTVQFATAVNSFTIAKLAAQVRLDSIEIVAGSGVPSDCQHTNKETLPAQGATCGATGLTAGEKCKDCGKVLVAQETVPATGEHNYVDNVCTVCGNSPVAGSSTLSITATTGTMGDKTIIWENDAFTFQNAQASSTNAIRTSDTDHFRMYSGSQTTITAKGGNLISSIEFTATSNDYATVLATSLTNAGYTATADGKVVTATFTTPVESFTFQMSKQSRINRIEVSFAGSAGEHTCSFVWTLEGDKHIKKCACGKTEGTAAAHSGTEDFVCDVCELFVAPAADSTLTLAQAIALGEAKGHNNYTDGKYYVEGVITEVYNAQYGNMYIKDAEGNTLTIFGTYSADGEIRYDALETKPAAGDTVKVYGIIGAYGTTTAVAQMKNGWIVSFAAHTCVDADSNRVCDLCGASMVVHECKDADGDFLCDDETCNEIIAPAADSTLTIEQANALGVLYASGAYTANKYYVEGVITEVYNTQYGNMYIKDAEGNTLTIYGTYSADGEIRYDALETKPVAGDTVKVYGIIGQYTGAAQMKNGWIVEHTPAACVDADNDHKCDDCGKTLSQCADTNKDHKCDTCSKVLSECADTSKDHKCDTCSKVLSECADTNKDHKCDTCSKVLSECADANKDHKCDTCSKVLSECADANKDHKCDTCSKVLSECADTNKDHKCDTCSKVLSECADTNKDHKCDVCSKVLSECADVNKDHKCDTCSKVLSECADTNKDHKCDVCSKVLSECADTNKDHKCDTCSKVLSECADTNKDHKCDTCSKVLSECADINKDHKCDTCSKVLSECADTNKDHKCDTCSKVLSECADTNKDHKCDTCSKVLSECADTNKDHKCDTCSKVLSECADTNKDHKCDTCSKVLSECADANKDHKCDTCSKVLSECADTNKDHKCDTCSKVLSECADTNKDHKCDVCSKVLSECADTNKDHKCDTCSKVLSECADTNKDHKCDVCSKVLSECVDNNNDYKCDTCGADVGTPPEVTEPEGTEPEPTEPTEPEPTEPEPTEPEPTEPEPTEPEPTEPEPTEPEPTEPEPTEPEPTEPEPTEPEPTEPEPTEPEPTDPTEPTEPEEPDDPTEPTEPEEPDDPTEPEVLFGDANGDGVVNLKDLSRLRKYFAGNDVEIDLVSIDLNGDGVVNLKDLTRLRKYLAGDDITLGK